MPLYSSRRIVVVRSFDEELLDCLMNRILLTVEDFETGATEVSNNMFDFWLEVNFFMRLAFLIYMQCQICLSK